MAVRLAEQRAKDERVLNFTAQAADAQDLNAFHNDTFHVATCILGLMFMPDHKSALREAHRVLQPGGLYVATVWGALIEFQAGQVYLCKHISGCMVFSCAWCLRVVQLCADAVCVACTCCKGNYAGQK